MRKSLLASAALLLGSTLLAPAAQADEGKVHITLNPKATLHVGKGSNRTYDCAAGTKVRNNHSGHHVVLNPGDVAGEGGGSPQYNLSVKCGTKREHRSYHIGKLPKGSWVRDRDVTVYND
jgi:hypothetical protein